MAMAKEQENDIDSLARMVAEGFKAAEKNMNERFDQVDERFDAIDARFDKVEERLGRVEQEVHQTNQRIDKVVIPELDAHASRIKDLEVHTGIHP